MENDSVQSGAHLGVMRSWIQRNAGNGETVIWGSQEFVALKPLTAHDLGWLAQRIKNAVSNENKHKIERVKDLLNSLGTLEKVSEFRFNIMRCIEDLDSL